MKIKIPTIKMKKYETSKKFTRFKNKEFDKYLKKIEKQIKNGELTISDYKIADQLIWINFTAELDRYVLQSNEIYDDLLVQAQIINAQREDYAIRAEAAKKAYEELQNELKEYKENNKVTPKNSKRAKGGFFKRRGAQTI